MRETSLWLNLLMLVSFGLIIAHCKRVLQLAVTIAISTLLTCGAYVLLASDIAPRLAPLRPLHWVAFATAVAVPYIGTAIFSYSLGRATIGTWLQVISSTIVGLLLLMGVPAIALALGCALTGICP